MARPKATLAQRRKAKKRKPGGPLYEGAASKKFASTENDYAAWQKKHGIPHKPNPRKKKPKSSGVGEASEIECGKCGVATPSIEWPGAPFMSGYAAECPSCGAITLFLPAVKTNPSRKKYGPYSTRPSRKKVVKGPPRGRQLPRTVFLKFFLTPAEIRKCIAIGDDAARICVEVVKPNIRRIDSLLGQKNDPMYLSYAIVYAIQKAKR